MQDGGTVTGQRPEIEQFKKYVVETLPRFSASELRPFTEWKYGESEGACGYHRFVEIVNVEQGGHIQEVGIAGVQGHVGHRRVRTGSHQEESVRDCVSPANTLTLCRLSRFPCPLPRRSLRQSWT